MTALSASASHSPVESRGRPAKRRKVDTAVEAPAPAVIRLRKPRYRPTERISLADSVLKPLNGFEYRELILQQQNPMRTGPARPPPDPGGPSRFARGLLRAAGKEMPVEEPEEPELDERSLVKLHRQLGKLATARDLDRFEIPFSLPTADGGSDAAARFCDAMQELNTHNREANRFEKMRKELLKRAARLPSIETNVDRASSGSHSRPGSASSHSTTVTVPPSYPTFFSTLVEALILLDTDRMGVSKGDLQKHLVDKGCSWAWRDLGSFEEYLKRAAIEKIVQYEVGCVRLLPTRRDSVHS